MRGDQPLLTLGECLYDLKTGRLKTKAGQPVDIRPQSAHVLRVLVDNLGQVVSKNELIEIVWPFVSVTDDSLVQCISDIRRCIGDSRRNILQTIPKYGYRLVGDSTDEHPVAEPADSSERPDLKSFDDIDFDDARGCVVHFKIVESGPLQRPGTGLPSPHLSEVSDALAKILGQTRQSKNFKSLEDMTSLEFPTAAEAVRFVLALQKWCLDRNKKVSQDSQFSMKYCVESITPGQDYQQRAAMLVDIPLPGEVISTVEVASRLVEGIDCDLVDLGEKSLPEDNSTLRCFQISETSKTSAILPMLSPEDLLPTVAVVPFTSRSRNSHDHVVGEILADDIISLLSRSLEINVISRLSTTVFRDNKASPQNIGNSLSADFILSGRYFEVGGKLEFDIELSEVKSGHVLWADRTTTSANFVFDSPETVDWIVSSVQRAIFTREVSLSRWSPLSSLQNHTLLMGAVALMHRFSFTDFNNAKRLLDALLDRAPKQPVPLAWMARWHVLRVQQGWAGDVLAEASTALEYTKRALDIDPDNVLALASEGFVLTNLLKRLDDAKNCYDRALEISPNDAVVRLLRGTLFAFRGDGGLAMRDTERSLHLTPFDPLRFFFLSLSASACIAAEDYERALQLADKSLRSNSTHTSTLRVKAVAQMRLNKADEALLTGQKLLKLQPNLRVSDWLNNSPSRDFPVGKAFGETLREIGIPNWNPKVE